ncbi:TonB-linked outer membrane protein, SusC/RagA family [Mucilaginibacter gossypiicola]|uniref:TonB-linked outer membrane protein, SusC/RagA family n=1 Tax=Mucilaginibacter gossypiicola TaxID=551995 RepID=A0A1H8GAB1_9SPHI|nr:TonB-dependent receptor [Mucilaginibacter gossypiicola]SEN40932.1 TonB-linked outer membrane protein, SusC/RagA family [Mucilaginibacter gossypiicola]
MNFNSKATPLAWPQLRKFILAMKLTAFIILAALTNVCAKSYSQIVTLHQKNTTVEKVLRSIEKQTGYHFMYDKQDVSKAGAINIEVANVSIENALDQCFKDQPLTYKIFDQTIVVKKKDEPVVSQVAVAPIKVTGTVSDAKGPIPGVTVKVKGTNIGLQTDVNGKYTINAPDANGTLVFTFIGYTTKEVPIGGRSQIDVVLAEEPKALSEVVVVGYGTAKKVDLTGSVGSVGAKQLQERPQTNLEQELSGKIAGVNVSSNSGAPGGATKIRIRGYSSINTNTDPLYVVDGVVWTEGGNAINPNDIETIDVLKDASSTAIYGTRGANGVILVTTKRGKKGGTISYDAYMAVNHMFKEIPVLNSKEFMQVEDISYANIKKYDPTGWAAGDYTDRNPVTQRTALIGKLFDQNLNPLYDVDWQKATTRTSVSQNHNVSFTGGAENVNYGLFLNYADDEGIIINSYLKRYNVRLTFDNQIKPWVKVGATLNYNYQDGRNQDQGTGGNNIPRMLIEMVPFIPIRYPDGTYGKRTDYPNLEGGDNPVARANEIQSLTRNRIFSGNGYLNLNIIPGLEFRSVLGVTTSANYNPASQSGLVGGPVAGQSYSSASIEEFNRTFWQWQNYFTYNKTFNKVHSINLVVGAERQNFQQLRLKGSTGTLSDDFYEYYNLSAGIVPDKPESGYDAWQMQSFFGRLNYNYNEKYLLTLTGREDGSSRFGTNKKYGFFPSAAFAWRASQEDFLKDNKTISDLKFRLSYGLTGNSEIGEYRSLANIGTVGYAFGGNSAVGTTQTSIGNEDLQWEKTAEYDLGFSLGLFNNRLNIEADAYLKKTKALLLNAPLPETSGFNAVYKNIGRLQNKGLEFTINATPIKTQDFTWNSTFNISFLKNKILQLGASNDDIFLDPTFLSQFNLMRVGLPAGSFYGYKVLGTWGTAEATEAAKYGLLPGDLKIQDTNGDGKVSAADKVILGKSIPDGYGTFSNNFRYKNIDLGVDLQFNYGNQIMNLTRHSGQDRTGQANSYATVLNAWTPTNQNTSIAEDRPAYVRYQTEIYSTKVESGNFIRGRAVTLGYTFNDNILKKLKLSRLRVYAQAQNLFLITKYTGYDPEVSTYNASSNFTQGIQFYDYPKPRTFLLGVNVSL